MPIENDELTNGVTDDANNGNNTVDDAAGAQDAGGNAAPAAEALTTEQQESAKEKSDLDAFQKGVDSLKGEHDAAADASPKEKPNAAAKPSDAGKPPAAKEPAADPAAKDPKTAKQPDADVEKEIGSLGLKGKSAERFREMAGEIKTTRPMMETLKGLNVSDPATLHAILKDASSGLQWEKAVMDSTAQPEQLQSALVIIKAMNAGDPKLQNMALDAMLGECKNVAERLGREIPGLTGDVLDKHPDLKQAVEAMDITRERALELAQLRTHKNAYESRDAANARSAQQHQQEQAAMERERSEIDVLAQTLQNADPHYAAKFQAMKEQGIFAQIGQLPVGQKHAAILRAYNAIPNPVAAPAPSPTAARVRPTQVTARGNNISPTGVARREFASDIEAFEFGVAQVSPHQ